MFVQVISCSLATPKIEEEIGQKIVATNIHFLNESFSFSLVNQQSPLLKIVCHIREEKAHLSFRFGSFS